jgi:glutaredoxin-like protein
MIPLREQEYIRERFDSELGGKVKIDYFTQRASKLIVPGRDECTYCEETRQMLEEVAALSDRVSLTVHELADAEDEARKFGIDKVPGIVVRGAANRPLRFFGIPGGNEFPNFIETIIEASKQQVAVRPETAKQLKKLKDDVSITVYVTPTCPHCPGVVRSAFRMALASARVHASAVEVSEYPRLAQQLGIRAVPLTVLNERTPIAGAIDETMLAEQVLKAAEGAVSEQVQGGPSSSAAPTSSAPGASGLVLPR